MFRFKSQGNNLIPQLLWDYMCMYSLSYSTLDFYVKSQQHEELRTKVLELTGNWTLSGLIW